MSVCKEQFGLLLTVQDYVLLLGKIGVFSSFVLFGLSNLGCPDTVNHFYPSENFYTDLSCSIRKINIILDMAHLHYITKKQQ